MANNTLNPVPSSDPRDLFDNATTIDLIINSGADRIPGRFGQMLYTWGYFHRLVERAVVQIDGVIANATSQVNARRDSGISEINQSVAAVDAAESAAKDDMLATAAALGDDLNNKHYSTYSLMVADPQSRDAVVAVVDGDPDQRLNGWYWWKNSAPKAWVRFSDQPAMSSKVQTAVDTVKDATLPGIAIAFGDKKGAYPLRIREDGSTEADVIRSPSVLVGKAELKASGIEGVAFAFLDSLGSAALFVREDGTTRAAEIDTDSLLVRGKSIVDLISQLARASSTARQADMVMSADGVSLVKVYPDMNKVSAWGSSSLDYIANQFSPMVTSLNPAATYYNGAKGGETSRSIAARLGAVPAIISVIGGEIPASGSVSATCANIAPNSMMRPYTGTVSGVYGTLSSDGSAFTFARKDAGEPVSSAANSTFFPDLGPTYRDGVAFLWMGKNDIPGTDSVAEIIGRTDKSFDFMTARVNRTLVFGHFGNSDWAGTANLTRALQINAAHKSRYGAQYVDTLSYICSSQVWKDTSITPTQQDLDAQAANCLAPSLGMDSAHFGQKLNVAFTAFVRKKLTELGW